MEEIRNGMSKSYKYMIRLRDGEEKGFNSIKEIANQIGAREAAMKSRIRRNKDLSMQEIYDSYYAL